MTLCDKCKHDVFDHKFSYLIPNGLTQPVNTVIKCNMCSCQQFQPMEKQTEKEEIEVSIPQFTTKCAIETCDNAANVHLTFMFSDEHVSTPMPYCNKHAIGYFTHWLGKLIVERIP